MLCGERAKRPIRLTVELNEHIVPNLNHIWKIRIDKLGSIPISNPIVVDLGTRSTRSGGPHLPEVVFGAEGKNTFGWEVLEPDFLGFVVDRSGFVSTKVSGVETIGVKFELFGETTPGEFDGILFEVVSEGPVPKHLKESMMINILSDIVQIIVLSTCTNAFLRINRPLQSGHRQRGIASSQKQGLVLIHARVGEEEGGIIVWDARA
mmetsp:Transcript_7113/g.14857  ORF Transcript_7113/g.14857 Transcript_7113/m.14857 type:complete len:207 (+) Transcript_7113:2295-2915(+)